MIGIIPALTRRYWKILEKVPTLCVGLGDFSKMLSLAFLILSSDMSVRTKQNHTILAGLAEALRIEESKKLMKLSAVSANSMIRPWLTL